MHTKHTYDFCPDKSSDEDASPLLVNSQRLDATKKEHSRLVIGGKYLSWALNLVLLSLVVYLCTLVPSKSHLYGYSPAYEAVEDVPHTFPLGFLKDLTEYQGWPNDEKDRLWEDMYDKGTTLRIGSDQAKRLLNLTEHIARPGMEQDFVIGLDVFHQLHCLNMLRKFIYPRRYNSSIVRADSSVDFLSWSHLDHCIESIRQSLTCASDISTVTYRWHSTKILEPELRNVHMCRNFSKIREWAVERWVEMPSNRAHVEGGVIVDHANEDNPEHDAQETYTSPEWWHKTVDDL